MSEHKEPIPSMIYNASIGGHVTNSQQIIDENENKEQSQINAEIKQTLGKGGSVDSRINKAKNDIIRGASSNGNTLKKIEDRVLPLESAVGSGGNIDTRIKTAVNIEKTRAQAEEKILDNRVDSLESAVGSGGSIDSRIAAAKSEIKGNVTSTCDTLGKAEVKINANSVAISTESSRAKTAEEQLRTLYNNLQQSQPIPVTELPAIGETGKIYRLVGATSYSDYMWNGTQFIKMATYNNAIDNKPIEGSENLVKSGGIFESLNNLNTAIVAEKNRAEEAEKHITYDISSHNDGAVFESLQTLLNSSNLNTLIPTSVRHGGMTISFIQGSVSNLDNKYVQYRCIANEFTTDVTKWAYDCKILTANIPGWLYVVTDYDGMVLAGIKSTLQVEWFIGIPTPVKNYIDTFIQGTETNILDGLNKIIGFLSGFTTSDNLHQLIIKEFSNSDFFNNIVEDFKCTKNFINTYDCIQLECGVQIKGKYKSSLNFYKTGWSNVITYFETYFDNYNDSVAYFIYMLEGKTFAEKEYYIKFKNNLLDCGGKSIFGKILYFDNCLGYKGLAIDSLPILTLNQDIADNIQREKIKEEKYKEVILNIENARTILDYDINYEMSKKTFQMLRTDEIVANDNILFFNNNDLGVSGFDGSISKADRRYFCMQSFSSQPHIWDFSILKPWIQQSVSNGKRVIPRLFTAAGVNVSSIISYTHINTKNEQEETNRINFPIWIADIMAADSNSQWYKYSPEEQTSLTYPSYWLLDYNVKGVRDAVIEGIRAFGDWLESETVINPNGIEISIKDAILYIEFNPLGSWGEGQMSPLEFRCKPEELLEVYSEFMNAAPDNVITTGGLITDSTKGIKFSENLHELGNNVCKYGFTIEHFGAIDKNVHVGLYDKYCDVVFFSGEGAGWYKNRYWGEDNYLNILEYMKKIRLSYVRIQNWTIEDADLNPLKNFPDIAHKCKQMLAFVGYRIVLSPTYCKWVDHNTFNIFIAISNLGCSKCWWSFYETHVIVTDENNNILSDNVVDIDITKCAPKDIGNIGTYSLGNSRDLNTNVAVVAPSSDISFKVYLRVVDKYGITKPLYFSNYGRIKKGALNGAYLIGGYDAITQKTFASLYIENKQRPI